MDLDPQIATFARLPRRGDADTYWIAALLELPVASRSTAYAALILTLDHGVELGPPAPTPRGALDLLVPTLVRFAASNPVGHRPPVIATDSADVEQRLRDALGAAAPDTEIFALPNIPPLDAFREEIASHLASGAADPGPLAGEGVTLERLRSFAEAARDYHRAAPWQHLDGDDLIQVESPKKVARGQKFAVVMGSGGETFGLAFYRTRKRYDRQMAGGSVDDALAENPEPLFAVVFHTADEVPPADKALWDEHRLPLASTDAYPLATFYDPLTRQRSRADAQALAHAEAMLRALAASTEEEMDTGRWTKSVTAGGTAVEYALALPQLLAALNPKRRQPRRSLADSDRPDAARRLLERAMSRIHKTPDEPQGSGPELAKRQAADLLDLATEARGRRRVQLARQALRLDPDAADAWNLLAHRQADPLRRAQLYKNGVDAGRRAIGSAFDEFTGHFWGIMETRPYMRARVGLALALRDAGEYQSALDHLLDMLGLNPGDNQGIRDLVPATLLAMGRDRDVLDHLDRWPGGDAVFQYARALARFRIEGDSPAARDARATAVAGNRYAAHHLTQGTWPEPEQGYGWSPGKPSEADYVMTELAEAWHTTPGALKWLSSAVTPAPPRPRLRGRRSR